MLAEREEAVVGVWVTWIITAAPGAALLRWSPQTELP